ncbi:hypothetical protein D3C81_1744930 [compost metagenome]
MQSCLFGSITADANSHGAGRCLRHLPDQLLQPVQKALLRNRGKNDKTAMVNSNEGAKIGRCGTGFDRLGNFPCPASRVLLGQAAHFPFQIIDFNNRRSRAILQ